MLNKFFTNYFSLLILGVMLASTGLVFAQDEKCELPGQPINQETAKDLQALIEPLQEEDLQKAERNNICAGINACNKFKNGKYAEIEDNCFKYNEQSNQWRIKEDGNCGLTNEEYFVLNRYTGSMYNCLNKFLREKPDSFKEIDFLRAVLNRALDKLPNYEGYVVRGTSLNKDHKKNHSKGKIVTYDAFTSTSTKKSFNAEDQFIILSRTGKPIMGISGLSYENEVLFKSGVQFKILDTYTNNGTNYYIMKEIIPGESEQTQKEEEKRILEDLKKKYKENRDSEHDSFLCKDIQNQPKNKAFKQKHDPLLPNVSR